jgi:hypothetical protein
MGTPDLDDRSLVGRVARKGIPSMNEVTDGFWTAGGTFDYLLAKNTLSVPICHCMIPMSRRLTGSGYIYRCRRCNVSRSIMKDTLFGSCRLPINQTLLVMWAFAMGLGYQTTFQLSGLSGSTVSRWLLQLRQLVTQMVAQTDCRIGGEGVVVQIDESKFGKRKVAGNRRGHRVEGAWVFGGVEKGGNDFGNNKFFCTVVQNRTAETLLPLIHR